MIGKRDKNESVGWEDVEIEKGKMYLGCLKGAEKTMRAWYMGWIKRMNLFTCWASNNKGKRGMRNIIR